MLAQEFGDIRGKMADAERHRHAETKTAAQHLTTTRHRQFGFRTSSRMLRMLSKQLAVVGNGKFARIAIQQTRPERLFQRGDAPADVLLGEHQLFSRSGKVARFDYGDVNPEIFNLHIVHLSVTVIVIRRIVGQISLRILVSNGRAFALQLKFKEQTMIEQRLSEQRGLGDHGWLHSRHTFRLPATGTTTDRFLRSAGD